MSKYIKVCDCPSAGSYRSFVAGNFRKVDTHNGMCVHCGYMAKDMSATSVNINSMVITEKIDEIQDQTLELNEATISLLEQEHM